MVNEMGTIMRYCPNCKIYRVHDNCINDCEFGKYEIRSFEKKFEWKTEKYALIIAVPLFLWISYHLIYVLMIILGFIIGVTVYLIISEDRLWTFNFTKSGFYVKMGDDTIEGNWDDNPAIYHFPNPTEPLKLIVVGRTKNLTSAEESDQKQEVNRIVLYLHNASDDSEIDIETKDANRLRRQIRNYVRKQFEAKNLWYLLLNTEFIRNPAPNRLKILKLNNIDAASDLINKSLNPLSNSTRTFLSTGWSIDFDSYLGMCDITIYGSKYTESKNYNVSIEDLEKGDRFNFQKNLISYSLLVYFDTETVSLRYSPKDDRELYNYIVQKGYLKI